MDDTCGRLLGFLAAFLGFLTASVLLDACLATVFFDRSGDGDRETDNDGEEEIDRLELSPELGSANPPGPVFLGFSRLTFTRRP